MAKFTLEIELGNDAMNSASDIAGALIKVAKRIEMNNYSVESSIVRGIMDENGNSVGSWEIDTAPDIKTSDNEDPDICPHCEKRNTNLIEGTSPLEMECYDCGATYYISNNFAECKFCNNKANTTGENAHSHDGGWVCECCWDERLRTTE